MIEQSPQQQCDEAADVLSEAGWRQRAYWEGASDDSGTHASYDGGPCCLVGALSVAAGFVEAPRGPASDEIKDAFQLVKAVLREQGVSGDPVGWNDAVGRRRDEVVAALRAAAQKALVAKVADQ